MTIGSRLKQRRLSLGYTLDDLRLLVLKNGFKISKAALSKYELDKSIPRATNLFFLSQALSVSSDYFLKNTNFEINWIAFRKTTKLSKKEEERIKFIAKEQVEAQLFLNNLIKEGISEYNLPQFEVDTLEKADEVASEIRKDWKIYNWPIESLTSLLEERSIFIVDIDSNIGFDGLSGMVDGIKPIIITVGKNTIDRKRFNISHELGHLVLKSKNIDEEKVAYRFAGAFLIQKESIFNAIGKKRRNIDIRELQILKEEYGISIQALIRRCYDLEIINESEYKRLNIYMRTNGIHLKEPGMCKNKEVPTKVKSRLLRAISEGLTTESEVLCRFPNLSNEINGDIMGTVWDNITEESKNKKLEESAKILLSEYEKGGSLAGFDIYDDVMDIE
jgi:Zn-dependent peptidase ImmA (M78 family)